MDGQWEIVNKQIIQGASGCKVGGNEWLSKIRKIQLRLTSQYNASHRNNPFETLLSFDAKLKLDTFPYHINKCQTATERHNAISQELTNAKPSQAKHANLHHAPEPWHKVIDIVLLSTKYINIKKVLHKMKCLCMEPFPILWANYNYNNYSLDLSSNPSLNHIYNTFHLSKVKPYMNNNSTLSSSSVQLLHRTRYCTTPLTLLELTISSTSQISCSHTSISWGSCRLLNSLRIVVWTMLCHLVPSGTLSL